MFIFDEEILDKLKTLKDKNEAINFIYKAANPYNEDINYGFLFNRINCCKYCSCISFKDEYLLKFDFDLSFPENQKMFKVAEDILEYAIENENYNIIDIVDEAIEDMFFSHENLDYLFDSEYIIWCTYTYKKILESDEKYMYKHRKRKIDSRFYKNRCLEWVYDNFDVIKHIPPEKITIIDRIKSNYTPSLEKHDVLKFVYDINPIVVLKNAYVYDIDIKEVLDIDSEDIPKIIESMQ